MTDNHDVFWRLLFGRINCSIEFFRFLLKEKSEILELENLVLFQEIFYRKKKLLYEFLYETPFRNSKEKMYFLLELKYRRAGDFEIQILKYKIAIHKWQNIEFGKLYYIILILFYQGLDNWDPECEFEEVINLKNSISSGAKEEIIIFDQRKIDLLRDFENPELKAVILFLKIIQDPWDDFIIGWNKIRKILNSMQESKIIYLEEEMLDYILKSRTENNDFLEEAIMGRKV